MIRDQQARIEELERAAKAAIPELDRFAAIIESRSGPRLEHGHGLSSAGPKRASDLARAALSERDSKPKPGEYGGGCPVTVWDGPYSYRCGLGGDGGICATHGPFAALSERDHG